MRIFYPDLPLPTQEALEQRGYVLTHTAKAADKPSRADLDLIADIIRLTDPTAQEPPAERLETAQEEPLTSPPPPSTQPEPEPKPNPLRNENPSPEKPPLPPGRQRRSPAPRKDVPPTFQQRINIYRSTPSLWVDIANVFPFHPLSKVIEMGLRSLLSQSKSANDTQYRLDPEYFQQQIQKLKDLS